MSTFNRLFWAQRVVIVALVTGIAMSFGLWFSDRVFPLIPVIPGTFPLTQIASQIALGLLGLSLLLGFIWVKQRGIVLVSLILMLVIGLQDYNRLQPWYWQYLLLFATIIPLAKNYKKYIDSDHLLFVFQIAIASAYFFSGLFKFNDGFFTNVFSYAVSPITNILTTYRPFILKFSYVVPPGEMFIAVLLFIPRLRIIGILLGTALHLAILGLLGPLGLDDNSIVWPWNLALIALLWLVFYKAKNYKYSYYLGKLNSVCYAVLLFSCLLPFLNLKGWYNEAMSYELYSGRSFTPHLRYHHTEVKNTPEFMRLYTFKYGDTVFVNTYNWSMQQYNTPPNSDWKVIERVQKKTLKHFQ